MIKRLLLIRHGEAEHLIGESLTGGWTDSSLTATGKRQGVRTANKVSKLLSETDFDFYSSDLLRAKESAQIIGKKVKKEPIILCNLLK